MVQRVTVFFVLASVFTNLFAGTEYKKYLQFAIGLIVITLVITPVLNLFGREHNFSQWLQQEIVEQEMYEKREEIKMLGEEVNRIWRN